MLPSPNLILVAGLPSHYSRAPFRDHARLCYLTTNCPLSGSSIYLDTAPNTLVALCHDILHFKSSLHLQDPFPLILWSIPSPYESLETLLFDSIRIPIDFILISSSQLFTPLPAVFGPKDNHFRSIRSTTLVPSSPAFGPLCQPKVVFPSLEHESQLWFFSLCPQKKAVQARRWEKPCLASSEFCLQA